MTEYKLKANPTSPAKYAIPYGVTFGIIMIMQFIIMQILKPDPEQSGWIGVVINLLNFLLLPVLLISLACNGYKNKVNNGYIRVSDCIKAGAAFGAIAGLVYAIGYTFYYLIEPTFIDEIVEQMKVISIKQNPKITSKQLEMTVDIIAKTMLPYIHGPINILMHSVIGLIISAIIGAVIKKENPGAF